MYDHSRLLRPLLLASVLASTIHAQAQPKFVLKGHANPIRALCFSPDGKWLYSGAEDSKVLRWDLEALEKQKSGKRRGRRKATKKTCRVIDKGNGYVGSLAIEPNGKRLAVGAYDGYARLWDTKRLRKKHELGDHGNLVNSMSWHPSDDLLLTGTAKSFHVWNTRTGKLVRTIQAHDHWVTALAISPDGKRVASGSYDKAVHVWDIDSGKKIATSSEQRLGRIFTVAWYPSGKDLILAGQGTAFVRWNVDEDRSGSLFRGHTDLVKAVAFRPKNKELASLGKDRTVRLWDPESAKLLETWTVCAAEPNAMAWSADGCLLATGGRDSEIRVWDVEAMTRRAPESKEK